MMPIQASGVDTCEKPSVCTSVHSAPMVSARRILLARPMMNRPTPSSICARVILRLLSSRLMSEYRTIGPAISCGEEHDEGAEVDQVVLHLDFAPVDIHRVGQDLEGVKADAQRQVELGGIQQRQAQPQQGIDVGQEEVCVLKKSRKPSVTRKATQKQALRAFSLWSYRSISNPAT